MSQLAICPQQHIWLPGETEGGGEGLTCPVCGQAGAPATVASAVANDGLNSLDAGCVPPIVADVKTIICPVDRDAEKVAAGTAPAVPGYDIVRELGRGGMGVVYLAQHHELKRLVALKMILAGAHADAETLTRFHREAEAVARLQHHGIVQIHDVGECQGRPYLALEYVDGNNLANQFATGVLAANAAASLVESLARTVHYAHQRGIVHRDLTPRNVLLARSDSVFRIRLSGADQAAYQPKITDFGLAKELDGDAGQTQSGVIMGTPSYMSPEQAQGKTHEIGPATDIHALGALLYEALTGRPPFLAETTLDTLRQVIEREPVPPTRLQPGVPRDLETICLKCLAKDAHKRYSSAEALADDLHRFLAREPILARPVPWHERAWKWARRHPTAAALAAVVVFAAAAFSVGGVVYNARVRAERDRAENNFQLAMQAVEEMLTDVGEKQLAAEPRMEQTRQALLKKALALHQAFLAQKVDDPNVRLETAQAHRRMADILRLLGQNSESVQAYDQALLLLGRLHDQAPDDAVYRYQMAYCHNMRGEGLRAASRHPEAADAYQQAQNILEALIAERPDDASYRQNLVRTHYNRGILLRETKQASEAESQFRQAVAVLNEVPKGVVMSPEERQHLARAYLNLGTVIPADTRFDEGKAAYDRAIENLVALTEEFPDSPEYRHELGVAYNNLGNLFARTNRSADAKQAYAQSYDRFDSLSRDFPKVPVYRQELANSLNSKGSVCAGEKDTAGAVTAWEQAATLLKELTAKHPDVADYQCDLGMVLGNLGLAHLSQSQLPQARANLELATDRLSKALAAHPDEAFLRQVLRDSYQNLAEVLVSSHDHAAAARAARALSEVFPQSSRDYYVAVCYLARCAQEAGNDSKLDAVPRRELAQNYADEAVALLRQAIEHEFRDVAQIEKDSGQALKAIATRPDFQELLTSIRKAEPGS